MNHLENILTPIKLLIYNKENMQRAFKINFNPDLVRDLIKNIAITVPGVDAKKEIKIKIDIEQNEVTIKFSVLPHLINVFSVAQEVQENIFYQTKKQFDLDYLIVNAEII